MKSIQKNWAVALICGIALVFSSCSKGPGAGGTSSITGKLHAKNYDASCTTLLSEFYVPDEDVYIIYGDDPTSGDDVKTGPDGTFVFKYLRTGKYKIYSYSKDCAAASGKTAVYVEVEITDRKQTVTLPDLEIRK